MTIVIVVVALLAVFFAFVASRPGSFRVQRTLVISAPAEALWPLLNDFRQWVAWSPWEKLDPAMTKTYTGPAAGPGAAYAWDGNGKAGAGRMEITAATPPSRLVVSLAFLRPFKNQNTVEFTLVRQGDGTEVTWAMFGPVPFVGKVLHLFFNMDKMVGKDFEEGLRNLQGLAQRR